ncbi:MAG: HypC/HybG/HupF family hydrogenase formation chaperone [Ignavibacteria bacterium]|nr:HypC/HybG/HupF family hydrogenase formation chaperone [Ignavibacteria bacterium]
MCLAVPGKVEEIYEGTDLIKMAKVNFGGVKKDVCVAWIPDLQVGDYVLVHVGFALNKIDEKEAMETLRILKEMGELNELDQSNESEQ